MYVCNGLSLDHKKDLHLIVKLTGLNLLSIDYIILIELSLYHFITIRSYYILLLQYSILNEERSFLSQPFFPGYRQPADSVAHNHLSGHPGRHCHKLVHSPLSQEGECTLLATLADTAINLYILLFHKKMSIVK